MKEEVVIIQSLTSCRLPSNNLEEGFSKWVIQNWRNTSGILGEPQYVAIHVKGEPRFRAIIEIDLEKSKLDQGLIAKKGQPIQILNLPT